MSGWLTRPTARSSQRTDIFQKNGWLALPHRALDLEETYISEEWLPYFTPRRARIREEIRSERVAGLLDPQRARVR